MKQIYYNKLLWNNKRYNLLPSNDDICTNMIHLLWTFTSSSMCMKLLFIKFSMQKVLIQKSQILNPL